MMNIKTISTIPPKDFDKEETKKKTEELNKKLLQLQSLLYAENKWKVLIVLQGMDASGKDGVIKSVFLGVNPMGCTVKSYKVPTEEEFAHDFLWRIHRHVPAKGMIQIFNRSHYEDILVPTIHTLLPEKEIDRRYDHINHFENLLKETGTIVLKFYLHISKEEQAERFKERLTNPEKKWKYNEKDIETSKHWDKFMNVYSSIIERCSPAIPWTIVPADKNWYRDFIVSKTLVDALMTLGMEYPK